jgi:uncharacterized membrane protein
MPSPHKLVAAILGTAGVAHFAVPKAFDSVVPSWMPGDPRITTYVSGVTELASAALVMFPKTRRVGGMAALATFIAVYPANIWAALDGGMKDAPAPLNSAAAAWVRLPLQFPMFWWAWKTMQEAKRA